MNIEFKALPINELTQMDISSDFIFSVEIDSIPVGVVYLSDMPDYVEKGIYIEWIEIMSVFRGKHLLHPIMDRLSKVYGKLYFESCDELLKKYRTIGAKEGSRDNEREMTEFTYAA